VFREARRIPGRDNPGRAAVVAVLRSVRLYGFAAWVYLAANSITHPVTSHLQLTHFLRWPDENTAAAVSLFGSATAFFVLRLIDGPRRRV
jgi:hypothetical protein